MNKNDKFDESLFPLINDQNMKPFYLHYIVGYIILLAGCDLSKTTSISSLELSVDSLVTSHLDSGIAGAVVGVSRGDEMIFHKAYGKADLEFDVEMPLDGKFQIGSITKQFTAVAILQLVEKGEISLEDDFTDYVTYDTKGRTVTINNLLDHTSGIKSYTELEEFGDIFYLDLPRDTLLRITEKAGFDFEPGEAVIYNNTAFYILGLIIEKVSEMSYEDYLQENIFGKVGMNDSYYCDEGSVRKNEVHGYGTGEDGFVHAMYLSHTWPFAAGSICSTVADMIKWNRALHGGEVLSSDMYELLINPRTLEDGTPLRYAKGLGVYQYDGVKAISHGGGIPGFLSSGEYYPEEDITIIVLVNTIGSLGPGEIKDLISDNLLDKTAEDTLVYEGDLSQLLGNYKGRGRGRDLDISIASAKRSLSFRTSRDTFNLKYSPEEYWFRNNTRYYFRDAGNELRIDTPGGHYVLRKDVDN